MIITIVYSFCYRTLFLLKKYLQIDISNLTKLVYYVTRYINSCKDNSKISSPNLGI